MNTSRRNWFLLLLGALTGNNYIKFPKVSQGLKAKTVERLVSKFKFSSNRGIIPVRAGRTINWYRFSPPLTKPPSKIPPVNT